MCSCGLNHWAVGAKRWVRRPCKEVPVEPEAGLFSWQCCDELLVGAVRKCWLWCKPPQHDCPVAQPWLGAGAVSQVASGRTAQPMDSDEAAGDSGAEWSCLDAEDLLSAWQLPVYAASPYPTDVAKPAQQHAGQWFAEQLVSPDLWRGSPCSAMSVLCTFYITPAVCTAHLLRAGKVYEH